MKRRVKRAQLPWIENMLRASSSRESSGRIRLEPCQRIERLRLRAHLHPPRDCPAAQIVMCQVRSLATGARVLAL
jgi:hypothetical protein